MKRRSIYGVLQCLICALSVYATPISLGTAGSFGVLGASTVTNTGATVIFGNLGVSPGSAYTGFPPGIVNGTIYAADSVAAQAQNEALAAYNSLAGLAPTMDLTGQDLGGQTLTPGVYTWIMHTASTPNTGRARLMSPSVE